MPEDYNKALDAFLRENEKNIPPSGTENAENTPKDTPETTIERKKRKIDELLAARNVAEGELIKLSTKGDPADAATIEAHNQAVKNLSALIRRTERDVERETADEKEKLRAVIVYKWPYFVTEKLPGKIPPPKPGDDIANGFRIASQYINDVLHVEDIGWFRWDVSVWSNVTDKSRVPSMFNELHKTIRDEIDHHTTQGKASYNDLEAEIIDEELRKAAIALGNSNPDTKAIEKSVAWLGVPKTTLDANDYLLNCKDCQVLLGTGEIREHRRGDYCTKSSPYEIGLKIGEALPEEKNWDAEVACPKWHRFLQETFCEDKELIDYVWKMCGYFATGLVRERKLFVFHGGGDNGKGVFTKVLKTVMGNYARKMPEGLLIKGIKADKRRLLSDCEGFRLLITNEIGKLSTLDENLTKALTGDDPMEGTAVFQQGREFMPKCKLVVCTNNPPGIEENDEALWRRIRLISFLNTVSEEKKNNNLFMELMTEGDEILQWQCIGARRYLTEGLKDIEVVLNATRDYREDEDTVAQYVTERIQESPGTYTGSEEIAKDYLIWARAAGSIVLPKRTFQKTFPNYLGKHPSLLTCKLNRKLGPRCYSNISLKSKEVNQDFFWQK